MPLSHRFVSEFFSKKDWALLYRPINYGNGITKHDWIHNNIKIHKFKIQKIKHVFIRAEHLYTLYTKYSASYYNRSSIKNMDVFLTELEKIDLSFNKKIRVEFGETKTYKCFCLKYDNINAKFEHLYKVELDPWVHDDVDRFDKWIEEEIKNS